MGDIKHHLRKLEFSQAVVESLRQLSKMNVGSFESAAQARSYQALMKEIVDEFVFWETGVVDRRNPKRKKLSAIKELHILESICHHFHQRGVGATQEEFFFVLFPPAILLTENRQHMLVKLSSLTLAVRNNRMLTYIGTWMQISGSTHEVSIKIAQNVIQDYFKLAMNTVNFLVDLPTISPLFCASLIIALTHLYSTVSTPPPTPLVEMVSNWIKTNPLLCYAPLEPSIILNGACRVQTPVSGLLLWCVLAPLRNSIKEKSDDTMVYSILHLALLETLTAAAQQRHRISTYRMMEADDIIHISYILKNSSSNAGIQLSLDYLAQILQVAVAMQCIQGRFPEMIDNLMQLPQNRLLGILIKKWRGL